MVTGRVQFCAVASKFACTAPITATTTSTALVSLPGRAWATAAPDSFGGRRCHSNSELVLPSRSALVSAHSCSNEGFRSDLAGNVQSFAALATAVGCWLRAARISRQNSALIRMRATTTTTFMTTVTTTTDNGLPASCKEEAKPRGTTKKLTVPSELLDGVDVFIFDCDGVIWRGDTLIPGIPDVLDALRKRGKTIFFVTNNSTKSRAGYKLKFTSLGLEVKPEEIFSSSFAAAAYFEQTKFKDTGKKVYVIGEKGIGEELDLIGVPWFGAEADKDMSAPMQPGGEVDHDPDVGAVCVGFDRHINYYKLQYAQLCLNKNKGCQFIATNLDRVTHLTDAQEWAGNGTMVGAIKGCTGMEPNVVGKPAPLMIDYIVDKFNISDRSRICMVGDRLDTDIAFGVDNGLKTCLTLSGVTTEPELLNQVPRKAGTEGIQPDFYVDTINDFIK